MRVFLVVSRIRSFLLISSVLHRLIYIVARLLIYVLGHSSSLGSGSGVVPLRPIPQKTPHDREIYQDADDQSNPESFAVSSSVME